MKNKKLYLLGFLLLVLPIAFFVSCENAGTNGDGSGSIVVTVTTPDISKGNSGYMEGTGTYVVENGAPVSYEFLGKKQEDITAMNALAAVGLTNIAMREKITITSTTSGSGLFDQFAGATIETQTYTLNSIDDPVPEFDSSSLLTRQEDYRGSTLDGTRKWEYYSDGRIKSERYSDNAPSPDILQDARYVHQYDETFTTMPFEEWVYSTDGSISIPDGYDYEIDSSGYHSVGSDTKITYTADGNGRPGQVLVQRGDHATSSWTNSISESITYDDSGVLSSIVMESWSVSSGSWVSLGKIDFTQPSDVPSIKFEDFFDIKPWGEGILPILYQ
jgi:hypothetical protein